MTASVEAPCVWPVDRGCLPDLPPEDDLDYDTKLAARSNAEDIAVFVLWSLSGRRFGQCPAVARPCPRPYPTWPSWSSAPGIFVPVYWGGQWQNFTCGCSGGCEITGPRAVHLPGPVGKVTEVNLGPQTLAEDEYVLEGDVLYRLGADWPHQNLGLPLPEEGTWSVEYLRGQPVPPYVAKMTGQLAAEFIVACEGGKCRLPRTVVSTSRSGVSHVFNPEAMLSAGYTGLPEVDTWLAAVNPHKLLSAPRVL
jgi:hypothetical protein